ERRVEPRGARVERECGGGVHGCRELLLEALGAGSGGDPVGAQRPRHLADLLFADRRRGEGEEVGAVVRGVWRARRVVARGRAIDAIGEGRDTTFDLAWRRAWQ